MRWIIKPQVFLCWRNTNEVSQAFSNELISNNFDLWIWTLFRCVHGWILFDIQIKLMIILGYGEEYQNHFLVLRFVHFFIPNTIWFMNETTESKKSSKQKKWIRADLLSKTNELSDLWFKKYTKTVQQAFLHSSISFLEWFPYSIFVTRRAFGNSIALTEKSDYLNLIHELLHSYYNRSLGHMHFKLIVSLHHTMEIMIINRMTSCYSDQYEYLSNHVIYYEWG